MSRFIIVIMVLGLMIAGAPAFGSSGGGELVFKPKNAKPVTFSHERHVNVKGLKCSACHNHTFQMVMNEAKMDMSKLAKGEFCGRCHNGERAFDVKDKANCGRCHV